MDSLLKKFKELKPYTTIEPKTKNDQIILGYVAYNDVVFEIINAILQGEVIKDYLKQYKVIKNKDIQEMNAYEIKVFISFISNGERFCEGHIAKYIDNGIFLKLYERYLELC